MRPHRHPDDQRTIIGTPEFLYIEDGEIEATVFDEEWKEIGRETLSAGDFLLFLRGGHSITMRSAARLLEVKQGPFLGDAAGKVYQQDA